MTVVSHTPLWISFLQPGATLIAAGAVAHPIRGRTALSLNRCPRRGLEQNAAASRSLIRQFRAGRHLTGRFLHSACT